MSVLTMQARTRTGSADAEETKPNCYPLIDEAHEEGYTREFSILSSTGA
jgi:hypothetical protein